MILHVIIFSVAIAVCAFLIAVVLGGEPTRCMRYSRERLVITYEECTKSIHLKLLREGWVPETGVPESWRAL